MRQTTRNAYPCNLCNVIGHEPYYCPHLCAEFTLLRDISQVQDTLQRKLGYSQLPTGNRVLAQYRPIRDSILPTALSQMIGPWSVSRFTSNDNERRYFESYGDRLRSKTLAMCDLATLQEMQVEEATRRLKSQLLHSRCQRFEGASSATTTCTPLVRDARSPSGRAGVSAVASAQGILRLGASRNGDGPGPSSKNHQLLFWLAPDRKSLHYCSLVEYKYSQPVSIRRSTVYDGVDQLHVRVCSTSMSPHQIRSATRTSHVRRCDRSKRCCFRAVPERSQHDHDPLRQSQLGELPGATRR